MPVTIPTDNRMLLIRNYDLFANLTETEFNDLELEHHFIEASKGEYIYFEAQHLNKLFFIKEGYIKIGFIDNDGNEVIKEIIQKGEIFGQFTLERDNLNGEFAQVHKSNVSLCAFTIEKFEKILSKNNTVAVAFTKQVGSKLRKVENRLMNMLNTDVRTRILRFLDEMVKMNTPFCNGASFRMPNFLTHDDIARLIGSSRQTVTMAITDLTVDGFFKITRKEIIVPNTSRLKTAALI
ncbi:MAG: Crp/Fnr family transcriptional regulator [Sphingobacteriales bacterium]|nr:MAG: Crp/Fnr family transcriptional regulator [Sphingobacteriales bacterium]